MRGRAPDWPRVCIADCCEAIVDCVNRTAPTVARPTPYKMIRTTNVKNGWIELFDVKYVTEEAYKRWTRRQVPRRGDVVLTREAPLGEAGMIKTDEPVFLGQRLVSYRVDSRKLDNYFLLYAFQERDLQAQIKALGSGATVEHMRVPDAKKLTLRLPPLDVQCRIASILSGYDDLIENNMRRIGILEEMARALYQEWFVHFRFPGHEHVPLVHSPLGPIPEGWRAEKLGRVAEIVMGQSPKSDFYNTNGKGLPFHQGVTDFGPHFPTDRMFCTVLNRIAEPDDILLSVRAPVGRINVATKRMVIGRGLSAVRSRVSYQIFLLSQLKRHFIEEDTMGSGTIFKAITKADLHGLDILVPSEDLMERFERLAKPAWLLLRKLAAKNANLRNTRDLLLPKLISGEIDVSRLPERPIAEAAD